MTQQFSDSINILENGKIRIELDGKNKKIAMQNDDGETININGRLGNFALGGGGQDGDLYIRSHENRTTITLAGDGSRITVGGGGQNGLVRARKADNKTTVELDADGGSEQGGSFAIFNKNRVQTAFLDGDFANLILGDKTGAAEAGAVYVHDAAGNFAIRVEGNGHIIGLKNENGSHESIHLNGEAAEAHLGGGGLDGEIFLKSSSGKQTAHLNGGNGYLTLGGNDQSGDIQLRSASGTNTVFISGEEGLLLLGNTIKLEARDGNLSLGGANQDGDLLIYNGDGQDSIHLDGHASNITMGGWGSSGNIFLKNDGGRETIHIDGGTGDIRLLNADCAEDFDVLAPETAEPGTVMVLDESGKLIPSTRAYDHRVAGVVSGAGTYKPGLVLDRQVDSANRRPIALMGKVFCKVDAAVAPIAVGDLLTTSTTPGHAMKANPTKASGAIVGKALRPLQQGQDLIPILVTLQ